MVEKQSEVSHTFLIRCIAITYWIFKSLRNFKCPYEKFDKFLETYRMHLVYIYIYILKKLATIVEGDPKVPFPIAYYTKV